MTTRLITTSCSLLGLTEPGGHRYFEQGKPLLSLSQLSDSTWPAQAK
jgi:hypothetical protein